MVNNPFPTVIVGDFNAKLSLWYNSDLVTYMKALKLMSFFDKNK